jgi:hypothetical protein
MRYMLSNWQRMVLSGGLSNHLLTNLLQCLTRHHARKDPALQPKSRAGWPDGRRKFGTVSGAIITVLTQSGAEMSVKAIRAEVEALLGGSVSRFSVSDYLLTRSKGPRPLFTRTRHGHYRLRVSDTSTS